jgi:hypothetical protein
MTYLENESTFKFSSFKREVYVNNTKTLGLNLTDNTRYVHHTHEAVIVVWGNNYCVSWNEPKHKNTLYWKKAEFFDVNLERSPAVCCALKD